MSANAPIATQPFSTDSADDAILDRGSKPTLERVFDYLLAASMASWAVLGLIASPVPATATRWAICALHLTVAVAIFRRAPVERLGSTRALAASIPALVLAGLAFRLAAPLSSWSATLEGAFSLGAALAIASFLSMEESFSVLPALRPIVSRGPYRLVRHPGYLGELIMIGSCALSRASTVTVFLLAIAVPLVTLRIRAEETLLSQSEAYRSYRARVRARLIPYLW